MTAIDKRRKHTEYCRGWIKRNKERIKLTMARYASNHPNYKREERDRQYYGGMKIFALRRDRYSCTICGLIDSKHNELYGYGLIVHHVDGNGKGAKHKNNALENLTTLCCACHRRLHSRKRAVRCIDTGKVFESISEASRTMGISITPIWYVCQGDRETAGGLRYEYYD